MVLLYSVKISDELTDFQNVINTDYYPTKCMYNCHPTTGNTKSHITTQHLSKFEVIVTQR